MLYRRVLRLGMALLSAAATAIGTGLLLSYNSIIQSYRNANRNMMGTFENM